MTNLLLESPVLLGCIGFFFALVATIVWTQVEDAKAQKASLYSAIGIIATTLLLILLSVRIETDAERIRAILHSAAASLEANDHAAVRAVLHPEATKAVQAAEAMLSRITFDDARVTRIKSLEIQDGTPRTALAEINVVVSLELAGKGGGRAPRFAKVYFTQHNDRWLVKDFEHFDVSVGFRNP